ncbi:hypothetical protein [Agilicoccus flavus]|uniref:hypothetical protein n=1 Tax=Agilicoccus flavus TaxID=2775968 RepID=UPI001CF698CB|nr:hypothetical protein [Agilicoccus flavus]
MTIRTHSRAHPTTDCVGIAGLVMGLLAVAACVFPAVGMRGMPLALLAMGLSIAGVVRAFRGTPDGSDDPRSALAGLILSFVAIGAAGVWFTLTTSGVVGG